MNVGISRRWYARPVFEQESCSPPSGGYRVHDGFGGGQIPKAGSDRRGYAGILPL